MTGMTADVEHQVVVGRTGCGGFDGTVGQWQWQWVVVVVVCCVFSRGTTVGGMTKLAQLRLSGAPAATWNEGGGLRGWDASRNRLAPIDEDESKQESTKETREREEGGRGRAAGE